MPPPVLHALRRMAGTDEFPARCARPDLIGREQCRRLLGAGGPVFPADQAARIVGAAQMLRAVDLLIYRAHGLMRRADRLAAAGALRHLVHAHRLVGPAPAVPQAPRAPTTASGGGRLDLPLGALDQDGRLDELQGMDDGLDLAAPDLLGAATLGERGDRANRLRVGLLPEDRLEIAIEPPKLEGELFLGHF